MKSCSVEGCPLVGCSVQKLRSILHWRLQLINSWSCLKTSRILQIQSSWHGSKTMFSIVNWRELDSWTLFLEKSIPLPHSSFLLSAFFEDKCSQLGPRWRILAHSLSFGYTLPFSWGCLESQGQHHTAWMHVGRKTPEKLQIWCWDPVKYLQFLLFL